MKYNQLKNKQKEDFIIHSFEDISPFLIGLDTPENS